MPVPDPTRAQQRMRPAGRRAEPDQPAAGLPLPHALPLRRRPLPGRGAAAARGRARPLVACHLRQPIDASSASGRPHERTEARAIRNPAAAPAAEPYGAARSAVLEPLGLQRRARRDLELARLRADAAACAAGAGAPARRRRDPLQGRARPLRPAQLQGAGRRLCRRQRAAQDGRGRDAVAATSASRDLLSGAFAGHRRPGDRHLRHRRQPRPLGRLGRAALRLPLRDLRARAREPGPARRDRALRRRGARGQGQLRRRGAPRRGDGRRRTAGPSCPTRPTPATATSRST